MVEFACGFFVCLTLILTSVLLYLYTRLSFLLRLTHKLDELDSLRTRLSIIETKVNDL